jgi:hypothetical protein
MKYFEVEHNTSLTQVRNKFGNDTGSILATNGLETDPNFAGQVRKRYQELTTPLTPIERVALVETGRVPLGRYPEILQFPALTDDSTRRQLTEQFEQQRINDAKRALTLASTSTDVFAAAVVLDLQELQVLSRENMFPDKVLVPDHTALITGVIGNNTSVPPLTLRTALNTVDENRVPFSSPNFSAMTQSLTAPQTGNNVDNGNNWHITLAEEVGIAIDRATPDYMMIPCYPDGGVQDDFTANFEEMPEARHQYEPWQIYKSSGGRTVTLVFKLARVLWSGDYTDGHCENLIRYCQSAAYCNYLGSLVDVPLVTVICGDYFKIRGYVHSVGVHWHGEFGTDLKPLLADLKITIQEVSDTPLNADAIRRDIGGKGSGSYR